MVEEDVDLEVGALGLGGLDVLDEGLLHGAVSEVESGEGESVVALANAFEERVVKLGGGGEEADGGGGQGEDRGGRVPRLG